MSDKKSLLPKAAWDYFKLAIAGLLIVATGSKILNAVPILAGDGLLASQPLLLAAIGFEAALACYLVIGNPFWSWRFTVATFSFLCLASGYALATGRSCNCIAQSVGPQIMLPIDLCVLGLTLWMRPRTASIPGELSISKLLLCATIGLFLAGGAALHLNTERKADPLRFMLADELISERWPLDSRLDPRLKPLESGRWMVLVIRQDCQHCRELIERHFAAPKDHREGERTAVFMASGRAWSFVFDHVSMNVSSDQSIQWEADEPVVASPAIFLIADGNVERASDGTDSDALIRELFGDSP